MSRIIVVSDSAHPQLQGVPVFMNEEVRPEHLQDGLAATVGVFVASNQEDQGTLLGLRRTP